VLLDQQTDFQTLPLVNTSPINTLKVPRITNRQINTHSKVNNSKHYVT